MEQNFNKFSSVNTLHRGGYVQCYFLTGHSNFLFSVFVAEQRLGDKDSRKSLQTAKKQPYQP